MLRPGDDLARELVLHGRARDLVTVDNGDAVVAGEAALSARLAFREGRKVLDISSEPPDDRLGRLVGVPAASGFRAAASAAVPERTAQRDLLNLLLDDLPVATLVSGYAVGHSGVRLPRVGVHAPQYADLCSGFRTGGTIMLSIERTGFSPLVTGPPAPPLDDPADPLGWHEMPALPAHGMRRRRRLDVVAGNPLVVDVLFRDSHMAPDGLETVIHEYTVTGTLDPKTLEVLSLEAVPRVLPWVECPVAAGSAERLIGLSVTDLRRRVRTDLTGPSTCTHLNDTLRSLEDVVALCRLLPGPARASWSHNSGI